MNTVQTIGVIMVLVSLCGIVLLSMPLGKWVKRLGKGGPPRAEESALPQEQGSFFDEAPRDELDRLGAPEAPSPAAEPPAALAEKAADSGEDAPPPAGPPAVPEPAPCSPRTRRTRRADHSGRPRDTGAQTR